MRKFENSRVQTNVLTREEKKIIFSMRDEEESLHPMICVDLMVQNDENKRMISKSDGARIAILESF